VEEVEEYNPYLQYTEVKRWKTALDLEPAQIKHEVYALMKKFMQ
jgi:hypothetical protein